MIFFALIPVLRGQPHVPEGWVLRREGDTGYFSAFIGARRPENRVLLYRIAEADEDWLMQVHLEESLLGRALPLMETWYCTLEELVDAERGPTDPDWRQRAADVRARWPEPAVTATVAGVDARARAQSTRRGPPALPPPRPETPAPPTTGQGNGQGNPRRR